MHTKNIQCKVLLEGVEVNFNAVTINESIFNTPTAIISFPASTAIPSILPRTICEVYYLEDGPDGVGDASGQFVQIFQGELSTYNFASTIDRRSVELTFKGFMQNFAGAPIVPIDVNFQTMISKSLNVITSPDTVTNTNNPKINGVHSAFLSKQSIIEQLLSSATLKGNVTISGIFKPLFENYINNVYLRAMMTLFGITKQIYYADPTSGTASLISKILTEQGFRSNVLEQGKRLGGAESLDTFITSILTEIGFDLQELAAPSFVNGVVRRILIKPEMTFFEPIKCNVVFNNDVLSLEYQRDIDLEPSRFIRQSIPFGASKSNGNQSTLLSMVVPADIYVGAGLAGVTKDTVGNITTSNILGLTLEERIRGVLLDQGGADGLESGYVAAIIQDAGFQGKSLPELLAALGVDFNNTLTAGSTATSTVDTSDKRYLIFQTAAAMAYITWMHRRMSHRMTSVTTPFNPYRLVGFPGAVMTDKYPAVVGMISSITSKISADGEAIQNLTFSHCSTIDLNLVGKTTALDTAMHTNDIPPNAPWYSDYTDQIDGLYQDITGRVGMSVRWGTDPTNYPIEKTYDTVKEALLGLKQLLTLPAISGNPENYQAFVYDYTRRALVPQTIIAKMYTGLTLRNITNEYNANTPQIIKTVDIKNKPLAPYVQERRDRVTQIFNAEHLLPISSIKQFNLQT